MPIDPERARAIGRIINWYLTPFAVLLVTMAAVSTGLHKATITALCISAITGIGNPVFVSVMRRHAARSAALRNLRIGFNYFFNIYLIYVLWPFWRPSWLLLLLSISAVGIFDTWLNTLMTASMFSLVLVVAEFLRGPGTWTGACEVMAYVAALWTAGLCINHLTHPESNPGSAS